MPRVISFIVLLVILLLVGAVFFQVMAQFMVPMFLACVLLVVFQPLHAWTLKRLPSYPRICAALTTVLILLAVLLPLTWLGWKAYVDFHKLFSMPESSAPANETIAPAMPDANADGEERVELADRLKTVADDLLDGFARVTGLKLNEPTVAKLIDRATNVATSVVISGVQSAIGILIGLAIMVLSLYYFLADGPAMIRTAMHLSPLDASYEQELLERFGQVSRAVVVATLLSAVVQGSLAGIGYYFALPSEAPIFLLTALTMVTAMVPFVGAAAMWILVCGWVYLYGEQVVGGNVTHSGNPLTAIVLAVYCTIVVSGIDNVIKPLVLHGQSKLHPLLALLSILGGVTVLGPVGILVGPMLVSFLQALLNMLRKELDSFGGAKTGSNMQLAGVVEAAPPITAENIGPAVSEATGAGSASASADGKSGKSAQSPSTTKPSGSRQPKRKRGR